MSLEFWPSSLGCSMLIPPGPARNSSLQSIGTRSCTRGTLDFAKPFLGKANDQATKRLSDQSIEQANKQRSKQAKKASQNNKKIDTQRHIWRLTWQGCGPGPAKDCIFGEWEVLCQIMSNYISLAWDALLYFFGWPIFEHKCRRIFEALQDSCSFPNNCCLCKLSACSCKFDKQRVIILDHFGVVLTKQTQQAWKECSVTCGGGEHTCHPWHCDIFFRSGWDFFRKIHSVEHSTSSKYVKMLVQKCKIASQSVPRRSRSITQHAENGGLACRTPRVSQRCFHFPKVMKIVSSVKFASAWSSPSRFCKVWQNFTVRFSQLYRYNTIYRYTLPTPLAVTGLIPSFKALKDNGLHLQQVFLALETYFQQTQASQAKSSQQPIGPSTFEIWWVWVAEGLCHVCHVVTSVYSFYHFLCSY